MSSGALCPEGILSVSRSYRFLNNVNVPTFVCCKISLSFLLEELAYVNINVNY